MAAMNCWILSLSFSSPLGEQVGEGVHGRFHEAARSCRDLQPTGGEVKLPVRPMDGRIR